MSFTAIISENGACREVAEGTFCSELFYRVSVVPIVLPPLRQRQADISHLAGMFLGQSAAEHEREAPKLSGEAMRLLKRYPWPGNVRELKNLMERIAILNASDEIAAGDLPTDIRHAGPGMVQEGVGVGQTLAHAERWLILKTLQHTGGNRTQAADLLGVTTRTLRNKLSQYHSRGVMQAATGHGGRPERLFPPPQNPLPQPAGR